MASPYDRSPQMERYSRHVLVCTGGFCSPSRQGRALYALLASLLQRENLLFGGGLKQPAPSPAFDETVESYSIPAVTEQISVSTFSYGSVPTVVQHGQTQMLVPTAVDYSVMQATHTIRVDPTMLCPMCHNATLVMESGCRHCAIQLGGCGAYSGCD